VLGQRREGGVQVGNPDHATCPIAAMIVEPDHVQARALHFDGAVLIAEDRETRQPTQLGLNPIGIGIVVVVSENGVHP